jgi:membrane peptidoglycan carboxypeptidase
MVTRRKRITQRTRFHLLGVLALLAGGAAVVLGMRAELESSPLQSLLFTRLGDEFAVTVEPDINYRARYRATGPYDFRLGYARIPEFLEALKAQGYRVDSQARLSPALESFIDLGGFPIYREKSQTGLRILDGSGNEVYRARHPGRVFEDFQSIPPVVVATLLYIENRELLDPAFSTRNPAVEWDRFAAAGVNALVATVAPTAKRFGGSTLATQIEKFRHSPGGRTVSAVEKLRQVVSASARAYLEGSDTTRARERIVVDYLNSTPLSGRSGFGEVIGLGEGLHVWYGTNLEELALHLDDSAPRGAAYPRSAQLYKQVLSLLLAQRRPSHYLLAGRSSLSDLTDAFLRLLAEAKIISARLRDAALAQPLRFREDLPAPSDVSFVERKAVNAVRTHLLSLLQVESLYELDRLDIRVSATLNMNAQRNVSEALHQFKNPEVARRVGLFGKRLLRRDPAGLAYSATLYERGRHANLVRVQADNLDRPLDLNEGGKFDLGSTAKLRTLTTYLEIIAELHNRYASVPDAELRDLAGDVGDPLSRWAIEQLGDNDDRSLPGVLEAAMERRYSGSPASFFTGGGRQSFENFGKEHNRTMSVREGFRHSVNLVFIRMLRDIIKYYQSTGEDPVSEILSRRDHPQRADYLTRFADREGKIFLRRYYNYYDDLDPDEALALLADRIRPAPDRLAVVFRSVRPQAPIQDLSRFILQRLSTDAISQPKLRGLYQGYGPQAFDLHDRSYIAGVHPLELWLVGYLQSRPGASLREAFEASADERQEVYQWLFKAGRKRAADTRIRILAEEDAFKRVHASWRRLGYPFASLVPSLATAIGSSADRPAALAELIGIILNDGIRLPTVHVQTIHLAEDTPYETHLSRKAEAGERLLPKQVTDVLRGALEDVVAHGTARRLFGVFDDAKGRPFLVGGKTGTGDELIERFGPGTSAAEDKEVSRSAALAFFLGDRHFGVITAHVPGPNVKGHRFTSALPTQILKALEPVFEPVVRGAESVPMPGLGPMLATHSTDDEAGQADVANRIRMTSTKRKTSRNLGQRADARRHSAPRIIDELF